MLQLENLVTSLETSWRPSLGGFKTIAFTYQKVLKHLGKGFKKIFYFLLTKIPKICEKKYFVFLPPKIFERCKICFYYLKLFGHL